MTALARDPSSIVGMSLDASVAPRHPRHARPSHRPHRSDRDGGARLGRVVWTVLLALGLGLITGPLSWYAHDHLTGAARLAGDSAAAWLGIAFLAGRQARTLPGGAVAGFLALGAAVASYYVTQASYGDWVETDLAVRYWQALAALAGPVCGGLGALTRTGAPVSRGVAVAAMSAACLAEAAVGYGHSPAGPMAGLYVGEALIGLLVLVVGCRWEPRSLLAGACALPILFLLGSELIAALLHGQHGSWPLPTDPGRVLTSVLTLAR